MNGDNAKTLVDIASSNDYVVIDTSVFIKLELNGRSYAKEVIRSYNNFFTDREILLEAKHFPQGLNRIPFRVKLNRLKNQEDLEEVCRFLKPLAIDYGIIEEKGKHYPMADLRVASVALILARTGGNVAFLSCDKLLDDFVYHAYRAVRGGGMNGQNSEKYGRMRVYYMPKNELIFLLHKIGPIRKSQDVNAVVRV
jgi:hypothetical protein